MVGSGQSERRMIKTGLFVQRLRTTSCLVLHSQMALMATAAESHFLFVSGSFVPFRKVKTEMAFSFPHGV